jgi:NADH-quinone oxidoreductase subunit H
MLSSLTPLISLLFFPGGLALLALGLLYEWIDHKLVARLQNRIGPRWFQPFADALKSLLKEEITPEVVYKSLFTMLPIVALAGALTAALYVPVMGLPPSFSFTGDMIVTFYLLSLLTLCIGIAGWNTSSHFSLVGATRALTQLFSYEAPFLLALLGPALVANTWTIGEINIYANAHPWFALTQPIGFFVALIGLMGKLELPPFDAPEAETEIVAGALTEYSGRGLALFHLGKAVELVLGLTLVATFYLGGVGNPLEFLLKTLALLGVLSLLQTLLTRLRIDQTVGLWWRYGAIAVLAQWGLWIIVTVLR